jgi:hypothetical protein
MPGASAKTLPVTIVNANWNAGVDAGDGRFEVMLVTRPNPHRREPPRGDAVDRAPLKGIT